jgi:hypothetical protein
MGIGPEDGPGPGRDPAPDHLGRDGGDADDEGPMNFLGKMVMMT